MADPVLGENHRSERRNTAARAALRYRGPVALVVLGIVVIAVIHLSGDSTTAYGALIGIGAASLSILIGIWCQRKGHTFAAGFLLSLFLTPLIGATVVFALTDTRSGRRGLTPGFWDRTIWRQTYVNEDHPGRESPGRNVSGVPTHAAGSEPESDAPGAFVDGGWRGFLQRRWAAFVVPIVFLVITAGAPPESVAMTGYTPWPGFEGARSTAWAILVVGLVVRWQITVIFAGALMFLMFLNAVM
jgi:hypothetical protein